MSGWICRKKPFWIPVSDTPENAYIEEWFHVPDEMKEMVSKHEVPEVAPLAPGPPVTSSPWDSVEAPLPPPSARDLANVFHPVPSGVELERLDLAFSTSDTLSRFKDDVDAHRAAAEYREGAERKPDISSPMNQIGRRANAR